MSPVRISVSRLFCTFWVPVATRRGGDTAVPVKAERACSGTCQWVDYIKQQVNTRLSKLMLEAGKMDKRQVLSDFDKGQIAMAKRLGLSISETADLVGCSEFTVQEITSETSKDKGAVSTKEKGGAEKRGRGRPRKNPQI